MEQQLHSMLPWLIITIVILAIWDSVWKLIAMWKAGRNNHLAWFICIAIFNTIGILPIIYIILQIIYYPFFLVFNHWKNRVNAIPIEIPNNMINQKPASLGLLLIVE